MISFVFKVVGKSEYRTRLNLFAGEKYIVTTKKKKTKKETKSNGTEVPRENLESENRFFQLVEIRSLEIDEFLLK